MLYLSAGIVLWLVHAVVPATVALAVAVLVAWAARRVTRLSARASYGGAALVGALVLGVTTWRVWRDFTHPETKMFRTYIANPVPRSIRDLGPGAPGPLMFHQGAVVAFEAPPDVVEALLDHSLEGSTALSALAELKSRHGHDTTTTARVGAPAGPGYVRADSSAFPDSMSRVFAGAYSRAMEALAQGLDVHVLAERGAWGRFESVVTYDRAAQLVRVRQYIVPTPPGRQ